MSDHPRLTDLVGAAAPGELPRLIGELESAKAAAWARLASIGSPKGEASDRLLSMPEARRLRITEHQAREMGRRRQLPVVHVGERHGRVSLRTLEDWIRRQGNSSLSVPRGR